MRTLCASLAVALTAVVVALAACGGSSLPDKPQIQPDKIALDWGSLSPDAGGLGEAVYVGTQVIDTVSVQNQGNQDLTISGTKISGTDSALFTAQAATDPIHSRQWGSVQVTFSPVTEGSFSATLEIDSNAENKPALMIPLVPEAVWHYVSQGTVQSGATPPVPLSGINVVCMVDCTQGGADAGFSTSCATTVWTTTTDANGKYRKGSNDLCEAIQLIDPAGKYQTEYAGFSPNETVTITMVAK